MRLLLISTGLFACNGEEATCPTGMVVSEGLCITLMDGGTRDTAGTDGRTEGGSDADSTPPTVVSSTPDSDALDVDTAAAITIAFSEALDPTTLTTGSLVVSDAVGVVEGTVAFDDSDLTATFTPTGPLGLLRQIDIRVTTAIQDLAGNGLAEEHTFSFGTRDGALGAAAAVETRVGTAGCLNLVTAPTGRAFVGWCKRDGGPSDGWSARFDDGMGWSEPALIESQSGSLQQLQMSGLGEGAVAVWSAGDDFVWSSRTDGDGEWGVAERIHNQLALSYPVVSGNASEQAVTSWVAEGNALATRYTPEAGWGVVQSMSYYDVQTPFAAMLNDGTAIVLFEEYETSAAAFRPSFQEAPAGSDWAPRQLVDLSAVAANDGTITLSHDRASSGDRVVIVGSVDSATRPIWMVEYEAGASWQTSVMLGAADGSVSASIAVDEFGGVYVAWAGGEAAPIHFRERSPAGEWSEDTVVSLGNNPDLFVDAVGNVTLTHLVPTGMAVLRRSQAGEWSAVSGSPFSGGRNAQFGTDDLGRGVLVWEQTDAGGSKVWGARFE